MPGEVLFIDEIHRMARSAEEMLYLAMEDFRIDIMVGKGAGATSHPARSGAVHPRRRDDPRRACCPTRCATASGSPRTSSSTTTPSSSRCSRAPRDARTSTSTAPALAEIAGRSRGTPRIANRLLRRVRDYALVHRRRGRRCDAVHAALELYDVDPLGLDRLDRAVMQIILTRFDGGPVGLNTLAVSVGEEAETIESVVEPFLVRIGLLTRTPRGRVATRAAWKHFGLPSGAEAQRPCSAMTYNSGASQSVRSRLRAFDPTSGRYSSSCTFDPFTIVMFAVLAVLDLLHVPQLAQAPARRRRSCRPRCSPAPRS